MLPVLRAVECTPTPVKFIRDAIAESLNRDYVKHSPKRIILIDGSELASLMLHHQVAVRTKDVYRIMEIDENYFSPE